MDETRDQLDSMLVATFVLGNAAFGVSAATVQEVVQVGDITSVHHSSLDVVGIRNLRGRIVTVIDLRARLELGPATGSPENRILIVDWEGEAVGLLVDRIADTISVAPNEVTPPPPNLHGVQGRHLRGVCRCGERLVALLDADAILEPGEHAVELPPREKASA